MSIKWETLKTKGELQAEADIASFKANRQAQLDSAIVTTSTGKSFDANEKSIIRMHNAVTYIKEHNVPTIPWSTADVGSGVMVECSADEIVEAHKLAVENMTALWAFNQNQ